MKVPLPDDEDAGAADGQRRLARGELVRARGLRPLRVRLHGAPEPAADPLPRRLRRPCAAQGLRARPALVLRRGGHDAAGVGDRDTDERAGHFETQTISIGPSHPATHGIIHLVARLDGEKIVRAETKIGYLHRCFEKMSETHHWNQIVPYCDRLNYVLGDDQRRRLRAAPPRRCSASRCRTAAGWSGRSSPSSRASWTTASASARTSSTSAR